MGLFGLWKGKERPDDGALARARELARQLDDPDPKVRLTACRELGRMGRAAAPASEKLQERLDDDDGDVCNAAAAALSEIER